MEKRVQNEAIIREYLLGRLDDHPELIERLDEQILADIEFSETVDLIEDEIIEDYLDGALNINDTQAVEEHFLRPKERQLKLRNARLLSHHLATASRNPEARYRKDNAQPSRATVTPIRSFPFRIGLEIAAAVLLIVSAVYLLRTRRELQIEVQRTAALSHQLAAVLDLAQPVTATLSLLEPGLRRGEEPLPELVISARTRNIHVEIALSSATPGAYNVRLENAGKTVWSQDHIEALTAPGGAILILNVPAQGLTQGEAKFVVQQNNGPEAAYWFLISTPQ